MILQTYGSEHRFALSFSLTEDPDQDGEPAKRASWAKLRIWADGRNLTAGLSRTGAYLTEAECPLLPIVEWLLGSWDYLLHEERFPYALPAASSAEWYLASLKELPSSDEELDALLEARRAWWGHHGLGAALPDYRIPDVHFRRSGERIEISWDDREWRSVPSGISLIEPRGALFAPISEVVPVLTSWCRGVLTAVAEKLGADPARAAVEALLGRLDALKAPSRQEARMRIAAGVSIERAARRIRSMAGLDDVDLGATIRSLLGMSKEPAGGYYATLSLPVLLYRSASPKLSDSDLELLLDLCRNDEPAITDLEVLRSSIAISPSPQETTQEGYDLAIDFRESYGFPEDVALVGENDLESVILPRLGVRIVDLNLSDRGVDGVAVMRPGTAPTLAVNLSGKIASSRWGRRMTLAHELCHLLHDGETDGVVGVVSNRWAPYLMERRANAFAAMLLMPDAALEAVLDRRTERWTRHGLHRAMHELGVGVTTLTRQLRNRGWISESEREGWVDELTMSEG